MATTAQHDPRIARRAIIAATTGWVIGGAIVMVMMCDLMVSTESTTF